MASPKSRNEKQLVWRPKGLPSSIVRREERLAEALERAAAEEAAERAHQRVEHEGLAAEVEEREAAVEAAAEEADCAEETRLEEYLDF